MSFRRLLAVAAFSLAIPVASHAQITCPTGTSLQQTPGLPPGNYSCQPNAVAAPEIGASSSVAGLAVLMGGFMMLRGRKKSLAANLAA